MQRTISTGSTFSEEVLLQQLYAKVVISKFRKVKLTLLHQVYTPDSSTPKLAAKELEGLGVVVDDFPKLNLDVPIAS